MAAAYVHDNGFEWCQRRTMFEQPNDLAELASQPGREYLTLAVDAKPIIVGPLEYERAFLRVVVATGLYEPEMVTTYSWPERISQEVSEWPPLDSGGRAGF